MRSWLLLSFCLVIFVFLCLALSFQTTTLTQLSCRAPCCPVHHPEAPRKLMDDAQNRRKQNLTHEWAHEWPHEWVHEWPHESPHESTHEGWVSCFQPFKESPRNIPRRCPRKGPRVDGRGSPVLFSPVLFFDQLSESTLPRESTQKINTVKSIER